MQIEIQSGAGQKALEFPYKLGDLALSGIKGTDQPLRASGHLPVWWRRRPPARGKINNAFGGPLHTICVGAVEGSARRHVLPAGSLCTAEN